jgi:hypothetical protein
MNQSTLSSAVLARLREQLPAMDAVELRQLVRGLLDELLAQETDPARKVVQAANEVLARVGSSLRVPYPKTD